MGKGAAQRNASNECNGLEEQFHAGLQVHDFCRRIIMENVVEEKVGGGCMGSCGK